MAHSKRICDTQKEDIEFLSKFEGDLEMLTGMVEEMFVQTPSVLLSPVMRQLIIDKARDVKKMHENLRYRLVIDNPGEPLSG